MFAAREDLFKIVGEEESTEDLSCVRMYGGEWFEARRRWFI